MSMTEPNVDMTLDESKNQSPAYDVQAATLQLKNRVRVFLAQVGTLREEETLDSLLHLLGRLQYSEIAITDLELLRGYIKALPDGALKADLIVYFRVMRSKAYEKINSIDIET